MKLKYPNPIVFSLALMLGITSHSAAGSSPDTLVNEIKECAIIENSESRIACYDTIGKALLEKNGSDVENEQVSEQLAQETAETKSDLPESLGGGLYAEKAGVKAETYRGKVKSCKKSSDRKWFYIFENGQVWKQVDSRKRRHKNCDFWVTIEKDTFGYKMVIDGQESKIRIDRRR